MINATELRIGNLIQLYRKPEHKEKSIHEINGIFYSDEHNEYCVKLKDGFIVNIKGIEGILLTERWADKLRFVYNYFEGYTSNLEIIKGVCGITYFLESKTFKSNSGIEFKYVHEIQNFYRFNKGEELNLKE